MSAAKHTPGPWLFPFDGNSLYGSDPGFTHTIDGVSKTCIECGHSPAECGPPVFVLAATVSEAEEYEENDVFVTPSEPDQRLIAAAPKLLDALEKAREFCRASLAASWLLAELDAAIAEATGSAA